ncbi:hypothetical protein CQ12_15465 [Bradyrhizobium jicamae]|uniref:Uncharacterized protein n=1 Tax=Bradyrhizobium jicamae TaxID=280332 RepID=A0A0R3L3B4_9BRAD|nr:hypothetical protein CQ12_15465 [Bradyrhizobium jicamae]
MVSVAIAGPADFIPGHARQGSRGLFLYGLHISQPHSLFINCKIVLVSNVKIVAGHGRLAAYFYLPSLSIRSSNARESSIAASADSRDAEFSAALPN